MIELNDRHVTFRVKCPEAVRVFLVGDFDDQGPSQVRGMDRIDQDVWQTEMDLPPGEYRFCYYLYDGRTIRYQPDASAADAAAADGVKSVLRIGAA